MRGPSHGRDDAPWQENSPRPWLASVSKVDSEVSDYLTYKTAVNPCGADFSGGGSISAM